MGQAGAQMNVITHCPECGKQDSFPVDSDGIVRWQHGEHIQTALPELTATQREQLITGICGPCWDKLFPDEDDK